MDNPNPHIIPEEPSPDETLLISDDQKFRVEVDILVREAEEMRLLHMHKHRNSVYISMTVGMIAMLLGASGFGWFLLMEADLPRAIACIVLAVVVPMIFNLWSGKPLKDYARAYKSEFMPRMAEVLGDLKFYPARGISAQMIAKTGVIPPHDIYEAEDCFMGRHKGAQLIISEAQMTRRKGRHKVFHGIFVLMEIMDGIFEGHTIITADKAMANSYADKRWRKLQPVALHSANPEWDRFVVYSSKPEDARLLAGERLFKELAETSDVFGKSPLTAVFFHGKYIFLMIPHERNMFEASNVYVPITMREHANSCKKEIERLVEIINVMEIYQKR